jgi:hypothetical protein
VIRDEWRRWIDNGPALYLASVNRDGTTDCIRASGLRIVAPDLVRLTANRETARRLVENIAAGSWLAVSVSNVLDYTCLQLKGVPEVSEPDALDVETSSAYREKFLANLKRLWAGLSERGYLKIRLKPELCFVLPIREIYDQTPGRGAGRSVAPP